MYNYQARVERVVDGDTIDLTISLGFDIYIKERVRLFGVDTPETRTRNKKEKQAGLKAKLFVQEAIEGKNVEIVTDDKGKFGRYLASLWYEHSSVDFDHPRGTKVLLNKELIDLKMAKPYYGEKKPDWIEE